MMGYWEDNLLRYLPGEFESQDFEIGDLKSLLKILAIPLDQMEELIDSFTDIWDIDRCEEKWLPTIAKALHYPLNERDSITSQRLQLKNAVDWYRRKGLEESFRILFYSLGYLVNVRGLWTKDYKNFSLFPGSWNPPTSRAEIRGTSLPLVDITNNSNQLAIAIDGGRVVKISLSEGTNRPIEEVASEIDEALSAVQGECGVDTSFYIRSKRAGYESRVQVVDIIASAYPVLELQVSIDYGIDYQIPDDWPELVENGGQWYKSPHFGIEAQSIRGHLLNPEELSYLRERIEMLRPAHTVLDHLNIAKGIADLFGISEGDYLGEIESVPRENWPFPFCLDRGSSCTYEYLRDGLVPDRSDEIRESYKHLRDAEDNCLRRNSFTYEFIQLLRNSPIGPTQMQGRGTIRFFRGGMPQGDVYRQMCESLETFEYDVTSGFNEGWCSSVLRGANLYFRGKPDTYYRDGSFTYLTSRSQGEFSRDSSGSEGTISLGFSREICKPPLETQLETLFWRADLPGIYFRSLAAMSSTSVPGLEQELPGPGEEGPVIS